MMKDEKDMEPQNCKMVSLFFQRSRIVVEHRIESNPGKLHTLHIDLEGLIHTHHSSLSAHHSRNGEE
jgi:hypothetical protein